MSLEFGVEFSCAVRRRYGEQTLRELARAASLNARFVNLCINSEQTPTPEMVRFVEQFGDKLQKIDEILPFCKHCPANLSKNSSVLGETIGCLGRINYPIDAYVEHFLANRLQLIIDTIPLEEWPRALHIFMDKDSPFDGEATRNLRRVTLDGIRFFVLRTGIKLCRRAAHLSTDNIFDLLAGFSATDNGASSYARELPVMALADYNELLEIVFFNNLLEEEKKRLIEVSLSFSQYLRYAEAIKCADELQVRMLID
ncbi:MAG: hypothetical protein HY819_12815 [Acidobacteria bacterium]|nr:hypothetical protein [Acidobacteriota bacterium]